MNSLYNTPPTWAIYVLGLVCKWILTNGGVESELATTTSLSPHPLFLSSPEMNQRSMAKSKMVFEVINNSAGFYSMPVLEKYRSRMNVPCRIAGGREDLEAKFLQEADQKGFLSLKGHRSVGGLRISLYNAIKPEEVTRLVEFMEQFMASNQ